MIGLIANIKIVEKITFSMLLMIKWKSKTNSYGQMIFQYSTPGFLGNNAKVSKYLKKNILLMFKNVQPEMKEKIVW